MSRTFGACVAPFDFIFVPSFIVWFPVVLPRRGIFVSVRFWLVRSR
jgi:hypothetical protein